MIDSILPVLAHPLTEPGGLPVPPAVVGTVALCAVAAVARVGRDDPHSAMPAQPAAAPSERLSPAMVVTRVLCLLLFVLAIAAGRVGSTEELENIAPSLIVGFAWPVLVIASALLGDVWRWINPYDTLARVLAPLGAGADDEHAENAYWAVPAALAWVSYLHVFGGTLEPRDVANALLGYAVVTLAGCLVAGRRWWLRNGEVFTVFYGWVGRLRGGGLRTWDPPRGADAVLGVLAGGLLFGAFEPSRLWGSLDVGPTAGRNAVVGLLGFCLLGWALLRGLERFAQRLGVTAGTVLAAAVPTVAAIAVAVGLLRSRLPSATQLLVPLASDPFGRGWDLFGTQAFVPNPNPLGNPGLVLTQVLVLAIGPMIGARVARQRSARRTGEPAMIAACALAVTGILAVTAI